MFVNKYYNKSNIYIYDDDGLFHQSQCMRANIFLKDMNCWTSYTDYLFIVLKACIEPV